MMSHQLLDVNYCVASMMAVATEQQQSSYLLMMCAAGDFWANPAARLDSPQSVEEGANDRRGLNVDSGQAGSQRHNVTCGVCWSACGGWGRCVVEGALAGARCEVVGQWEVCVGRRALGRGSTRRSKGAAPAGAEERTSE